MSARTANRKGLFDSDPPDACSSYKNVRTGEKEFLRKAGKHCEDLWSQYEPYADSHFLNEFPRRFHQRWFEMYLTVSLIRSDFDVQCPKPGPDILLNLDGRRVWVEAVCATPGEEGKADSVPKPEMNVWAPVPMDQCVLRAAQSLKAKSDKFGDYLQNDTVSPEDLFVVAINIFLLREYPHFDDVMKKALYGMGDRVVLINRDSRQVVDMQREEIESVKKQSGALVGVQPFFDGSMRHISSVWAFPTDAANFPQTLGADCVQYPNLSCANRWPVGAISLGEEWCFRKSSGVWSGHKRNHGATGLIRRGRSEFDRD